MRIDKQIQGKRGEELAVSYLRRMGWQIVERNFRIRGGEIDIVAIESSPLTKQQTLVFVEVKARSSDEFGSPLEAITYYKLRSLIKTAEFYRMKHPYLPALMRIDAVSVILNERNELIEIELVKNIS